MFTLCMLMIFPSPLENIGLLLSFPESLHLPKSLSAKGKKMKLALSHLTLQRKYGRKMIHSISITCTATKIKDPSARAAI